ncbi:uncharacterized protein AB675_12007 [Cyphellophora attinorum]|uniref:Uncharacterized protein n=1 Tax=Cyphellophora attinorum TaxID=1664694 RepID=A0A0N1H775_9EURO|nr:uncharacterized protein AB675_12007 [Phialophora attinorum]KPI38434.1 hypothetical protein AB675_12007 [Phialophora attinorum]
MPGINASALLLSQGWAGPGHALGPSQPYRQHGTRGLAYDPSSVTRTTSSGLLKPLLVSKKDGNKGLGRKAHEPARGNEWWLKGFEMNLQMGRFGGLYSYFLPGGSTGGTLGKQQKESVPYEPSTKISEWGRNKRKSDVLDDDDAIEQEQDEAIKKSKKHKTTTTAQSQFAEVATFLSARDAEHEQKRQRKEDRRKAKAMRDSQAFGMVGEFLAVKEAANRGSELEKEMRRKAREERRHRKEEKRKRRSRAGAVEDSAGSKSASPAESEDGLEVRAAEEAKSDRRKERSIRIVKTSSGDERPETREERKARRALRKEKKQKAR